MCVSAARRATASSLRQPAACLPSISTPQLALLKVVNTMLPEQMRVEQDTLGDVDVPADAYYGAQTQRAVTNFQISGTVQSSPRPLIKALGMVKLAAVRTNRALGDIDERRFAAIETACEEIIGGAFDDQFVIDVYQGGAGTSTNMKANEIIANRALEHLRFSKGRYDEIHPNNHVNLSQSTNDVYPTAIRLALLDSSEELVRGLHELAAAFDLKAGEFADILKLGRTQLQDAVPMTLGQEFGAFATTLREDILRVREVARFMLEINLGGTAIGTGITADPAYSGHVVAELVVPSKA
ncbi:lyase family protein [Rhizobium sp. S152]|uniref:lyase family protein n=1 Tax=Rhizobium sp. S152 TaxID=3055038 RepID=UPI0025A9BDB0|nr:lyase family protein [Rhizobium sp. S152]MDM9625111.1 lyase family protein [Rhizobium sp. S152]